MSSDYAIMSLVSYTFFSETNGFSCCFFRYACATERRGDLKKSASHISLGVEAIAHILASSIWSIYLSRIYNYHDSKRPSLSCAEDQL